MKKFACFVLVLALLIPFAPRTEAASTVYFTSVNDSLLDLTAGTMPFINEGVIYVPYSVFTSTGLGIYGAYNRDKLTLTIYNSVTVLAFDLKTNTSYVTGGATYKARAIWYNSHYYVPASFVCGIFGLKYSYISTDVAPLIRIKNDNAVLNDEQFTAAANSLMKLRLAAYNSEYEEPTVPDNDSGNEEPAITPAPQSSSQPVHKNTVYLMFDCSSTEYLGDILDILDDYNFKASFFLNASEISSADGLVRRIIGSGHSMGITGYAGAGDSAAKILNALGQANSLIDEICKTRTRIILSPVDSLGISVSAMAEVSRAGYHLVGWNVNAIYSSGTASSTAAKSTINKIKAAGSTVYVRLDASETTKGALATILRSLEQGNYNVYPMIETVQ